MRNLKTFVLAMAAVVIGASMLMASTAQADSAAGPDCAVLGPIGANAIPTLAPWQSIPQDQAAPQLNAYLANLRSQQGQLTTNQGKADLQGYIDALQNATSPAAAPQIYAALNRLTTDCPS